MSTPKQQFNRAKIVDYDKADPESRAEMEKLIEPMDRNPDDFQTVASYGGSACDRLSKIMVDARKFLENAPSGAVVPFESARQAETLSVARIEAVLELNLHLGASKEVLRRYNEEYIPQATATYNANLDPDDDLYLHDVLRRKEDFIARLTVLEGIRAQTVSLVMDIRKFQSRAPGWVNGSSQPPDYGDVTLGRAISVARKPLQLKKPGAR